MKPLIHYEARIKAAVDTNQCLDYAEDVSELVAEVKRLRAGVSAAWEFMSEAYTTSKGGPFIGYSQMRAAEATHQVADRMWDVMFDAMGPGWRP